MGFGRRFGIDYGAARIGIAVCDSDGLVATPVTTLQNDKDFFENFRRLQSEYSAVGIYLGRPKQLSGQVGTIQGEIDEFADKLVKEFNLPISWVDERLTSSGASQALRERGLDSKSSKGLVDQLAAVSILELGIALEKNA
ncbi:MAG: hypothetical protein RL301_795 [Actinomycetota bacterium]|jgi:putative Holliday junction resolvase